LNDRLSSAEGPRRLHTEKEKYVDISSKKWWPVFTQNHGLGFSFDASRLALTFWPLVTRNECALYSCYVIVTA